MSERRPRAISLTPGRFYTARDGEVWCCYRLNHGRSSGGPGMQAEASCIRVSDSRVEYFYRDGRYDEAGERELTLTHESS